MKTKDLSKELKTAVENKKDLKIYLIEDNGEYSYFDTFKFNGERYQGKFGCIELEEIIREIGKEKSYIKFEIA